MCAKIVSKTTESMLLPTIRHLTSNLYAAVFELMKLMPAKYIFDRAEEDGVLSKGGMVIESSSGTFGLALALLCSERKYKLKLISDPVIDEPLRYRLQDLGAELMIVDKPAKKGGIQQARLNKLYEHLKQNPDAFWPKQYDNIYNPKGYEPLADHLKDTVGDIDYLVAAVGSGGSSGGTYKYLKPSMPNLRLVGVDSVNSVIFGRPDAKRLLRGLGGSIIPKNVDHKLYNEVHWVTDSEAFRATRIIHSTHQLYMGPTSGAVYMVGRWLSKKHKDAKVVCIFADTGHRYESTVYCDEWLQKNGIYLSKIPQEPKEVKSPNDAGPGWSYIKWNNRRYDEVIGER